MDIGYKFEEFQSLKTYNNQLAKNYPLLRLRFGFLVKGKMGSSVRILAALVSYGSNGYGE